MSLNKNHYLFVYTMSRSDRLYHIDSDCPVNITFHNLLNNLVSIVYKKKKKVKITIEIIDKFL